MDINALNAFKHVSLCGSFSDAGYQLSLTQPAITKRIQKLEQHYGCMLLERNGKTIKPTHAGLLLLAATDDIMTRLNIVAQDISALNNEVSGKLSIITSHHIGIHRLPPTLKQFYDLYPKVQIDISFADSEIAHNKIAANEADFGIVTLAPKIDPKLKEETIWHDPLIFMANKTHPLIHKALTLNDLSKAQAVLPGLDTYTGQIARQLFNEQGLTLQANMATNYLETIKMLVSVGLGWTMLPRSMLDDSLCELKVAVGVNVERRLGLIQRHSYRASAAAEAFFELLRAQGRASL